MKTIVEFALSYNYLDDRELDNNLEFIDIYLINREYIAILWQFLFKK